MGFTQGQSVLQKMFFKNVDHAREVIEEAVTSSRGEATNHVSILVSNTQELIEAVEYATTHYQDDTYYDIFLSEGKYELWDVLDKATINNRDIVYKRGLELPDKCNLHGIGTVEISCSIPEKDNAIKEYSEIVSTINMHNTENILDNLHIIGSNVRYCIHDDSGLIIGTNN